jgi:U3 small nucleolar RNA-associated protein 24
VSNSEQGPSIEPEDLFRLPARDERWERLVCDRKGVYADDCIIDRITKHKIFIVATNDRDLKRRVRKVPGVPMMSVARGKYNIERLPDAPEK